jgi:hypothetical protein
VERGDRGPLNRLETFPVTFFRLPPISGETAAMGAAGGQEDRAMCKWFLALIAVAAISVGIAWGEGKNDQTHKAGPDTASCCCCAKSCSK